MAGKIKRRSYLVNKKLQLQFSWLLALQAAIPIILLGSSLYVVNKVYLLSIQRIVGISIISDVEVQSILNFSVQAIVVLLVITVILLTFIGVRFSHHVAGPLYKIEKTMEKLAQGEKVERLVFRNTDAVDGLADKINVVIERMGQLKG